MRMKKEKPMLRAPAHPVWATNKLAIIVSHTQEKVKKNGGLSHRLPLDIEIKVRTNRDAKKDIQTEKRKDPGSGRISPGKLWCTREKAE